MPRPGYITVTPTPSWPNWREETFKSPERRKKLQRRPICLGVSSQLPISDTSIMPPRRKRSPTSDVVVDRFSLSAASCVVSYRTPVRPGPHQPRFSVVWPRPIERAIQQVFIARRIRRLGAVGAGSDVVGPQSIKEPLKRNLLYRPSVRRAATRDSRTDK